MGRIFFWLATIITALIVIFAIGDLFTAWGQGHPIIRVVALIAAGGVWLIGWICRALLP